MRLIYLLLLSSILSCNNCDRSINVFDLNNIDNIRIDNHFLNKQYPRLDSDYNTINCLQHFRNELNHKFQENGIEWNEVTRCEMELFISTSGTIDYVGYSFNHNDEINSANQELFMSTINSYIDSCDFCANYTQNYSLSTVFYFSNL
jgi:hypothetical protein